MEEVNGTEPVRSTTMIPNVTSAIPREREKYSSITGTLVSGQYCNQHIPILTTWLPSFRRE
jgi:hypothetical protein